MSTPFTVSFFIIPSRCPIIISLLFIRRAVMRLSRLCRILHVMSSTIHRRGILPHPLSRPSLLQAFGTAFCLTLLVAPPLTTSLLMLFTVSYEATGAMRTYPQKKLAVDSALSRWFRRSTGSGDSPYQRISHLSMSTTWLTGWGMRVVSPYPAYRIFHFCCGPVSHPPAS